METLDHRRVSMNEYSLPEHTDHACSIIAKFGLVSLTGMGYTFKSWAESLCMHYLIFIRFMLQCSDINISFLWHVLFGICQLHTHTHTHTSTYTLRVNAVLSGECCWMLPLATHCHLHPFHFVTSKIWLLSNIQHTHTHTHTPLLHYNTCYVQTWCMEAARSSISNSPLTSSVGDCHPDSETLDS